MTQYYGHDRQIAELIALAERDRLHHGWIFAGPRGIGKAGIASDFAKRLLLIGAGEPVPADQLAPASEHPIIHLLEGGAHPDFACLQRLEREDRKGESGALARNITVDQVRGLARLLSNAPSMGTRRVVLIDSADDLEAGAANALLKMLEEPPSGVTFLLISHAPGRLLPTIRSRCRVLRFAPLGEADMLAALADLLPDATAEERAALARTSEGAPGQVLASRDLDLPGLEAALIRLSAGGAAAQGEQARLVQALSPVGARARLEAFVELVPRFIAAQARAAQGEKLAAGLAAWETAQRLSAGAIVPLALEPGALVYRLCAAVIDLTADPRAPQRV